MYGRDGYAVAQIILTKCLPDKTFIQTSTETIMTTSASAVLTKGCSQTGPGTRTAWSSTPLQKITHFPLFIHFSIWYRIPVVLAPNLLFVFLLEDSCSAGSWQKQGDTLPKHLPSFRNCYLYGLGHFRSRNCLFVSKHDEHQRHFQQLLKAKKWMCD